MNDARDEDKVTLLLRDVPGDVVRALEVRAERNFRSRQSEVLAILAAVCRGNIALPDLAGDAAPAAPEAEPGANADGGEA